MLKIDQNSSDNELFLGSMPSLLKFKSWVPHLSGTNTNNINLLVVKSFKIFNKTLLEEGIYA